MKKKISVIISTYNNSAFLKLSLESYNNQTYNNFELIVADDGSTKETTELIKRFRKKAKFPIKHVWQEDKGFRLARVRNLGIKASRGEYLMFTDQDCIVPKSLLENLSKLLQPNLIIQGATKFFNEKNTNLLIKKGLNYSFMESNSKTPFLYKVYHKMLKFGFCEGRFLVIKKKVVTSVNGFNQDFRTVGGEDTEFCIRLIKNKVKTKPINLYVFHLYHDRNPLRYFKNTLKAYYGTMFNQFSIVCKNGLNNLK